MKDQYSFALALILCVSVLPAGAQALTQTKVPTPAQSQTNNQKPEQKPAPVLDAKQQRLKQYLDSQSQREKARYDKFYGDIAKNELKTGQNKAAAIRQEAASRQQSQWSRDTDRGYVPLHERFPGYVPYSIREGQRNGNIGTGKVKPYSDGAATSPELEAARMKEQMAEEKAEELKNKSKEKQAMVDQAMSNMESQMQDSKVQGAAVLKPHGSNLYIRYYGSEGQTRSNLNAAAEAAQIAAAARQKAAATVQNSTKPVKNQSSQAQNLPGAIPRK